MLVGVVGDVDYTVRILNVRLQLLCDEYMCPSVVEQRLK